MDKLDWFLIAIVTLVMIALYAKGKQVSNELKKCKEEL